MAFTLFKRRNVTTPSETEAAGQGFVPPVPPGRPFYRHAGYRSAVAGTAAENPYGDLSSYREEQQ